MTLSERYVLLGKIVMVISMTPSESFVVITVAWPTALRQRPDTLKEFEQVLKKPMKPLRLC
ncbi:hypothetical protein OH492_20565 [Vibrio chagasii]|nr:hypothetical protein [Vibrio chagasii]